MLLNLKFDYEKLKRETAKSGSRVYLTPGGTRVPSVTTVLSKTKDMTFLKEWRKSMGEERANEVVQRSIKYGNRVHQNLEDYIMEGAEASGNVIAKHMTKQIITKGLSKVSEIWGCEVMVYAEGIYAGTTDACGLHENDESIIDFKNARSLRKEEWVQDYKLQVAAYALCHNEMFDTNIRKGVVMLATQDGHYQEWIIEDDEFDQACEDWANRLEEYYKKYR